VVGPHQKEEGLWFNVKKRWQCVCMCLLWITSIVVELNNYYKKMGHRVSCVKKWLEGGGGGFDR
jgi:hypothetical protein